MHLLAGKAASSQLEMHRFFVPCEPTKTLTYCQKLVCRQILMVISNCPFRFADSWLYVRHRCGLNRFIAKLEGISKTIYGTEVMVRATLAWSLTRWRSCFKIKAFDILTLITKQSMQQKNKDIGGLQTDRERLLVMSQIEQIIPLN